MPFPNNGQRRKIIWQLPTLTESGEKKQRISKLRSHHTLLHYPSAPAMPFPNIGQRRKIIWGEAYRNRIRGEKAENIELAIASCTAAIVLSAPGSFSRKMGEMQNNLAIAYSERYQGRESREYRNGERIYRNALTISTREAFPQDIQKLYLI